MDLPQTDDIEIPSLRPAQKIDPSAGTCEEAEEPFGYRRMPLSLNSMSSRKGASNDSIERGHRLEFFRRPWSLSASVTRELPESSISWRVDPQATHKLSAKEVR